MESVFSLGMSFLPICWLIVDVSNMDVSNTLHVAQMIHVEDRNGEPQLLLGGNMGGGVTAATMRTLGL